MERNGRDGSRVTLADVARRAGFSRSTASLVFQESPLVASSTREAVLTAAAGLGYVYDRRAAALRTRRSHTVGLLIPGLGNPFFAALVQAVEERLGPAGFTVLLANTLEAPERQDAVIQTLVEYRVDGLLVVPAIGSDGGMLSSLGRLRVPHVLMTRHVDGVEGDWVGSDDRRGGAMAAEHLTAHGCRTVAYLGGPPAVFTRAERRDGFLEVVRGSGSAFDEAWSVGTATSSSAGYEVVRALLSAGQAPPEGLACHSDAIAFGVMRALQDGGVVVGSGTRVIGYDDVEHARAWSPSLSSISVSSEEMGRAAAGLLLRAMSREGVGEEPRTVVLEPLLRPRESCGHCDRT